MKRVCTPSGGADLARRACLGRLAGAAGALALGLPARAQAWPARPLRVVLGYTPGGSADTTARELTVPLTAALGQPLVVDYKAGASGAIAGAEVARAAPDGYTLGLLDNAPLTIVPTLRNAGYDPLSSFTPIIMVSHVPQVLVASASAGVGSLRELIEAMRKSPGRFSYASGGAGSVGHLTTELFKSRTGTYALHVPYRGGAPAINALLAGEVQFAFLTPTATQGFIQAGKLKALGVSSRTRLASLPGVPTIAESAIPGFEAPGWFALVGPAGLPEPIVSTLRRSVAQVLATPAVVGRLEALGQTLPPAGQDVRGVISAELATWKQLVAERKLVIEG